MKTNGCGSVKKVGIYVLAIVLALFLMSPSAIAEDDKADKAAANVGGQAGQDTDQELSTGTMVVGALVAAAIAGVALTQGGDDIVVIPPPPEPEPEPEPEPPTTEEEVADLVEATDQETQVALVTLTEQLSDAELVALEALFETADPDELDELQAAIAGVGTAANLEIVLAALELDDEITRGEGDQGFVSLCAGDATVETCLHRTDLYLAFMELGAGARQELADLLNILKSGKDYDTVMDALKRLLASLDASEFTTVQDALKTDDADTVTAAILHAAVNSDNGKVTVTTFHHGNGNYSTIYH